MTGVAIVIEEGPGVAAATRLVFGADSVTLGRLGANDVCLPEATVSARHLEIRREGRDWYATDLGSSNGTHLNGQRVSAKIPKLLRSDDALGIGGFRLRVELDVPVSSETSSSTAVLGRRFVRDVLARLHPSRATPRLQVVAGPDAGKGAALDSIGSQLRIGRAEGVELPLTDALASRDHALVRRDLAGLLLVHRAGRNGTLVNGSPVETEQRLHDRDEIRVGNTRIAVSDPSEALVAELEELPEEAWLPEPAIVDDPPEPAAPAPSSPRPAPAAAPAAAAQPRPKRSWEWLVIALAVAAIGGAVYLLYTLLAG